MVAQLDDEYSKHGLRRKARRLTSYAFFEGRPATTKGQWFNPVVFAWLRLLAAVPGSPPVDKPIFITGLGRSGTTILGMLLSLHPEVGFLNEPKAIWHVIDPRQDVNGNYGGAAPRYRLTAADLTPEMSLRGHRVFARYLGSVGARRLVDKYPELIFRVPYVRAMFPDARFVFIYRSGVDACQSIVNWSKRLAVQRGDSLEDWWGRNDSKWNNFWRDVVSTDPACAEITAMGAASFDHANRAALEWALTMREGLAQAEQYPDCVVKLRYEDLLANPDTELKALMQACGLPLDESVLEYARARLYENPAKPLPTLAPPVQALFDDTMLKLGYR